MYCVSTAHSDSVWGVAWTRNETLEQELILTGSVDNTVRVWAWSVYYHYNIISNYS